MNKTVTALIQAEVIEDEMGYYLVCLKTGFGDPVIRIAHDAVMLQDRVKA